MNISHLIFTLLCSSSTNNPCAAMVQKAQLNAPVTVVQTSWQQKLRELNQPNNNDGVMRKFRIVQIGDSHTAGDYFTNQLRTRLQAQWGNGGIGWVFPAPVSGQRSATVRYQNNGWTTSSTRTTTADFPLGGVLAQSAPNASLTIEAASNDANTVGLQNIEVWAKPIAAPQTITVNGQPFDIASPDWQRLNIDTVLPLTINADAFPWQLGAINIENRKNGVTVSAMGVNGAQLSQWSKWRPNWTDDLKQTQADLVILAYGTNEAFNDKLDIAQTEATWQRTIQQIKATLPNAGILIVGAPESLKSKTGECGVRPMQLTAVQAMQQRVAYNENVLFWSWENAMGGECSMTSWISQGLAANDGVHFKALGYQTAADQLANYLIDLAR